MSRLKLRTAGSPTPAGRHFGVILAFILLVSGHAAQAEAVEIAPGVRVTRTTYAAPVNQQPFYGFSAKSLEQRTADDNFVDALSKAAGSRENAFSETIKRGWLAINAGNLAEAAQRFNQAFLLAPEQSSVYHGFAVIAQARFNDSVFADELFRIARKQPNPLKTLNADYGRLLLIAKRPRDAQPVLEQAVIDMPDFADAWSNLAHARLQNGDRAAACVAVNEALKHRPSANAGGDLTILKNSAQCP